MAGNNHRPRTASFKFNTSLHCLEWQDIADQYAIRMAEVDRQIRKISQEIIATENQLEALNAQLGRFDFPLPSISRRPTVGEAITEIAQSITSATANAKLRPQIIAAEQRRTELIAVQDRLNAQYANLQRLRQEAVDRAASEGCLVLPSR